MAVIGVVTLELRIEQAHSLKDKRHVVKSLKDRLRNKFNVAVAEIEDQDLWQRAVVAAVTVSADHTYAEKVLQSVEEEAAALLGPGSEVLRVGVEGRVIVMVRRGPGRYNVVNPVPVKYIALGVVRNVDSAN